jgi:hypothetical protein
MDETPGAPPARTPEPSTGPKPPGPPKGPQGWAANKLPIVPGPRPPVGTDERRRAGNWNDFRRAYPGVIGTMWVILVALLVTDVALARKRDEYSTEVARLRSGMSVVERRSADLELANNEQQLRVMVELARRQAQGDKELHLSVAVDSGVMYLEREGALLREMPVRVGPERRVGVAPDTVHMVAPRGSRTVVKILTADSTWDIPRWVYADRHMRPDSVTAVKGALGEAAIVLNGGAVIYGDPRVGPLADTLYVLPGSIRARTADIRAIAPNLRPGTNVYLY